MTQIVILDIFAIYINLSGMKRKYSFVNFCHSRKYTSDGAAVENLEVVPYCPNQFHGPENRKK